MIRFKNKKTVHAAFTLLEVLIAIAIIGIVLTPLFVSQSTLFKHVITRSLQIDRLMQVKAFLAEARRAKPEHSEQFVFEKKVTKPATQLKYEFKALPAESPFSKIAQLYQEQVTASWQERGAQQTESFINFVYQQKGEQS